MKKNLIIFYILLIMFSFFAYTLSVDASEQDCSNFKSSAAKNACINVERYCSQGVDAVGGCQYDKNNTLYTRAKTKACYGTNCITLEGTLTRGYQAVDKNGKAAFAGCYKVEYAGNTTSENKRFSKGTYYIFKILSPSKDCKESKAYYDIVPPNNIAGYDGKNAIGGDSATYKWVAKNNGNCPVMFGLTGNTTFWTAKKNTYVFADNENDLKLDKAQFRIFFWNSEKYETSAGCTVQDKEGFEQAIKCYDDTITILNDDNQTKCPPDFKDLAAYKEKLNGLADKCGPEIEKLYRITYLKENAEIFTTKLKEAVNKRLTSCQFGNCNLTETETNCINNEIKKQNCPDGCSGKTGTEYDTCFNCLKGVYESSTCKLGSTKSQCLIDSQKQKDEAVTELGEGVSQDQQEHVEHEQQESEQIRHSLYSTYATQPLDIEVPEMPGEGGGELSECDKILGSDLTAVVKASITILQIVGAIIAVVKGMMVLIPPVLAKDADALKKASKTLVTMAIILVVIFLFRPLLRFLGSILDFDTSCIL